uniref:uncharacterized protein LOC120346420 n=1 Tax=Styela clava TaxID=7725 RepID=UPI0019398321|nr:uncharacterized protein LOC120346420 [Styela clava]
MSTQFLYACAVLFVSVSATDLYQDYESFVVKFATSYVESGRPEDAKRLSDMYILRVLSQSPEEISSFKDSLNEFISRSKFQNGKKILAFYGRHKLDSSSYSAYSTLDLIDIELSYLPPQNKLEWKKFRDILGLQQT